MELITGRSFDIDRMRFTPAPSFAPEQPTIPGSLGASDEAQADIVMILDPGDPLVEISVSDNFVRASEIRVSLGTRGGGIGTFYEDHIDGPAIDRTIPLSAVEEVLETESQDEADWARADKSLGFIEDHPPSLRIVEAPRTPPASSPLSHPPLPTLKKKQDEEKFWETIRAVGPPSESSDDHLQVDFHIDTAKEDGASEAEIHIVCVAQIGQSAQQDNNMSTTAPIGYVEGTSREFINFPCKQCGSAYPGYLVQATPWADDSRCSFRGAC